MNYLEQARAAGKRTANYIRTLTSDPGLNDRTIQRAAVGFVNRLPLNDIPFEHELEAVFVSAAREALSK
jgi:hypothetical protein